MLILPNAARILNPTLAPHALGVEYARSVHYIVVVLSTGYKCTNQIVL